jgi:AraC-like DNA-binding protein
MMAMPTSIYREHRPPAALAGQVLCVWSQMIGPGGSLYRHRVLPDGCADLVWIGEAPAVVAGPARGPVVVGLRPRTLVVGVRLRPGAASAALGLPASELADRDTPLRDLWGPAADALSTRIVERPSSAARLTTAAAMLAGRFAEAGPPDPMIAAATCWLARHPERRVADLARLLEVSERRLHRRFTAAVGYGPKTLQRVLRLQRLLALAAEAGYADQAHMSRELRRLTGRSPGALLRGCASTLELSDLFKTEAGPAA